MSKVTVIIVSSNDAAALNYTLDAYKATDLTDVNTLLIDNASEDETAAIMADFQTNNLAVKLETLSSPMKRGALLEHAVNDLIETPYFFYLSPGMKLEDRQWIQKLVAKIEQDEKIASISPLIISPNNTVVSAGILFMRAFPTYADQGDPFTTPRVKEERECVCSPLEGTLMRIDAIREAGNFSPEYVRSYDGLDVTLKAKKLGYKNIYYPQVEIVDNAPMHRFINGSSDLQNPDVEWFMDTNGGLMSMDDLNNAAEYYGSGTSLPSTEYWKNKENAKGTIVCFLADQQGCGHYRLKNPYRGMVMRGWDVIFTTFSPENFFDVGDIFVYQRQCADHMLEKLHLAHAKGKKIIYEIDDFFHGLEPQNPVTPTFAQNPEWLRNMEKIIYNADALTVSTPELANQYGRFNSYTTIVPNHMDLGAMPNPILENHDGTVRIGWGGSATHNADIALLRGVIEEITKKYANARFVFLATDYRPYFPEVPEDRMEWIPSTFGHEDPVGDYYKAINQARLDIGVAPITNSLFNRCKSDVKIMEYGAYGIAVVASDVEPYSLFLKTKGDEPKRGFLCRSPQDWVKYISRLIEDEPLRLKMGRTLQEYVWTTRGAPRMTDIVEKVCINLMEGKGHKPSKTEPVHSLPVPFLNNLTALKAEKQKKALQAITVSAGQASQQG